MEFPTLVYKCPGDHFAHGGATYKYSPVKDQETLDKKIAEGWHISLVEAVDAFKNKSVSKPEIINENAAPTREEMEIKAKELGIKFDGRTNDFKLLKLINESM